jgi:anti-anti-sigma regulatory factor
MVLWNVSIDEHKVMQTQEPEIVIDFGDLFVINSSEIRKLLIIKKDCEKKGKKLIFKTQNTYLKDLFTEFGFDELGIEYQ